MSSTQPIESEWDGAKYGREESTGVIFGMETDQVIFISSGAVVGIIVVMINGFPWGLAAAIGLVIVSGGIGIPRIKGNSLIGWARIFTRSKSRQRSGNDQFVQKDDGVEVDFTDDGEVEIVEGPEFEIMDGPVRRGDDTPRDKKNRIRPGKPIRMSLPGEFGELLVYQLPGGGAFIYDPVLKVATIVAEVMTEKAFQLNSFEEKEDRLREWVSVQSTIARIPGVDIVQLSDQTTMISGASIRHWYEEQILKAPTVTTEDGETARQAGADVDPFMHQSLVETIMSVENQPVHDMWMAVVLSKEKLNERIVAAGGGVAGFMETALSMMGTIENAIPTSGAYVTKWHSPHTLAARTRTAFDPDSAIQVSERGEAGVAVRQAGPMYAAPRDIKTYESDGALHRTYKISEWPHSQARLGFLEKLVFAGDFRHTVSLYIKPRDTAKALKANERDRATWSSNDKIRDKIGKQQTARKERQIQDLVQEEDEVTAGHAPLKLSCVITVTAETDRELNANCADLETRAAEANLELRILYGQAEEGFMAGALPFGKLEV